LVTSRLELALQKTQFNAHFVQGSPRAENQKRPSEATKVISAASSADEAFAIDTSNTDAQLALQATIMAYSLLRQARGVCREALNLKLTDSNRKL